MSLTGDTGYFWFFDDANVELVVKVLDGRTVNGHFWVFYGALSSVEYTITVTDTQTGEVRTYQNERGNLASVADTAASEEAAKRLRTSGPSFPRRAGGGAALLDQLRPARRRRPESCRQPFGRPCGLRGNPGWGSLPQRRRRRRLARGDGRARPLRRAQPGGSLRRIRCE